MKERPIIFSNEMVLAILEGRKTQTRRVIKPQPYQPTLEYRRMPPVFLESGEWGWSLDGEIAGPFIRCPYGQPGDRLWVKEVWRPIRVGPNKVTYIEYRADGARIYKDHTYQPSWSKEEPWRSSLFMPRKYSRIDLEITNIRAERLQDISEEDAKAEGITGPFDVGYPAYRMPGDSKPRYSRPSGAFEDYWNLLNAKRGFGWSVNPWVWALSFKRVSAA